MNSVNLVGRITADLELQKTNSKRSWVRFTLAVNRNKDEADFITVVAWDEQAENLAKYMAKGSQISVEGRIQTGSYEKGDVRVYTTDIIAHRIGFLSSVKKDGEAAAEGDNLPF